MLADGHAQPEPTWHWNEFLRLYYVADNAPYTDGYPRRPAARFRVLGDVQTAALLPEVGLHTSYVSRRGRRLIRRNDGDSPTTEQEFVPSEAFEDTLAEFVNCRPDLAPLEPELYVTERIVTRAGTFISAFLQRSDSDLSLVTIVLRSASGCAVTSERPAVVDAESRKSVDGHGGYSRQLWDIVPVRDQEYVVALQQDYEARCFQVYRISGNSLEPVAHVSFACLGCQ
jgi:hypothetical protein